MAKRIIILGKFFRSIQNRIYRTTHLIIQDTFSAVGLLRSHPLYVAYHGVVVREGNSVVYLEGERLEMGGTEGMVNAYVDSIAIEGTADTIPCSAVSICQPRTNLVMSVGDRCIVEVAHENEGLTSKTIDEVGHSVGL